LASQVTNDAPGLRQFIWHFVSCLLQVSGRGTQRLDGVDFEHGDSMLEGVLVAGEFV
jgi:hypothetical protein